MDRRLMGSRGRLPADLFLPGQAGGVPARALAMPHAAGRGGPVAHREWQAGPLAADVAAVAYWLRTILVPVDGTHVGESALPLALGIARRAGATVVLAHVVPPRHAAGNAGGFDSLEDRARWLASTAQVAVRPLVLTGDRVGDALREAADRKADLVVMATRARGPLGRLWYGSVCDRLVGRARVPVLLVRGGAGRPGPGTEPELRRVLVPLDMTRSSERAVGPAVAVGSLFGAECELVHVVRAYPTAVSLAVAHGGAVVRPQLLLRRDALRHLRQVARRIEPVAAPLGAQVLIGEQPVADAIARYADTHRFDPIAVAARGRGGLSRLIRESVADQVVRRANVPVLVCPPAP